MNADNTDRKLHSVGPVFPISPSGCCRELLSSMPVMKLVRTPVSMVITDMRLTGCRDIKAMAPPKINPPAANMAAMKKIFTVSRSKMK